MMTNIIFNPQLYISDTIDPSKLQRIKRSISKGKGKYTVIIARSDSKDMLEIYDVSQLAKIMDRLSECVVGGITSSNEEAVELMVRITEDCQKKRGDLNLKEFILCGHLY